MQSQDSTVSTTYIIKQKDDRTIEVFNKNTKKTTVVKPVTNPRTGDGEAFDLREYTKGNFDLKAYSTEEIPIITWYSKKTGGDFFHGLWSPSPINPNFF